MVSRIMSYLNDDKLIDLGRIYKVDKPNHKIIGAFIVKSFVKSVLTNRPISLRSIEVLTKSSSELNLLLKSNDKNKRRLDHSSLGKRLGKIPVNYFSAIYEDLVSKSSNILKGSKNWKINRFDSTILTLSGMIIKDGLNIGGSANDMQIKMSVGLKGALPSSIRFCTTQSEASEEVALVKAINEAKLDKEDIILFDRGISSARSYNNLTKQDIRFVTRVRKDRIYKLVKTNEVKSSQNSDIRIISDQIVNLYHKKKLTENNLRLIKAVNKHNTEILFLTNLTDSSAIEIADTYKLRWDIEVFFKFLKQNLQFKHFITHNLNGMRVYIYSILIAALLFIIFKHENKLTGFKIPLLEFTLKIEKEIIKDLIILCGGDPTKLKGRL